MSTTNSGSTYQSIVIAIVAGGIVSAGIMSIVWRRRARRRWMEARRRLPPGGDERMSGWVDGWDVGRERRRGEGVAGKEPEIWDVVLSGQEKEDEDEEEKEEGKEGKEGKRPYVQVEEDKAGRRTPGPKARNLSKWTPTSLSLSLSPKTPTKPAFASPLARQSLSAPPASHLADLTVLVAMPDPDAPGPSRPKSPSSHDDQPNDEYRYRTRAAGNSEDGGSEGYLPPLEIGSSSVTIQTGSSEGGDEEGQADWLEDLFKTAQSERKNDRRKAGRDRTDDPWSNTALGDAARDPLASPSAAARFAVIRYGALSGFAGQGAAGSRRSTARNMAGPPPADGGGGGGG